MGRPSKFNRQEAVEIVMNEIWKHGFEACSVKAISEKLGITRSSFYNAFESREALFLEALGLYFEQSPDKALGEADEQTRIVPLLRDVFREVCRVRAADPEARGCLAVNSVSELVGTNEALGSVIENAVLGSLERLQHLLGIAARNGEIDSDKIREKALALQNLLIGLSVICKVVRSEDDLWAATSATLDGLGLGADLASA